MNNTKPKAPDHCVTEPCEIDYSSPYAVMKELTDADFTSVPLDEPAFFEVATNDKVANKITIGYEALSLVFDLKTLAVRALLHGTMPPQWKEFVRLLSSSLHLCAHPLLLPVLVLAGYRRNMERYRAHIDKSILALEQETGFGASGFLVTAYNAGSGRRDFHIESALVRLQSQQTELSNLANVSRYSESLAAFLKDANNRLSASLNWEDHAAVMKAEDGVVHMLELVTSQAKTCTSVAQALKERVQSQTNLIFSLISSEENRISRHVAEESAKVAISSKRDSMAMKTVAVLTMIFLPGTFVAAFLSMPLFEWNADTGAYPSSTPFQWIYWAITLPLTIILMIGWRAWWAIEEKSWRLELEQVEMENRQKLLNRPSDGRVSIETSGLSDISRDTVMSGESRLVRWRDLRLRNLIARGR
ncbi:hypothetical protein E8E14_013883 [Neopestalotiopsis sp. 37M]|nr:hypothetical protein E8E14_013883 [Neopestalotiopsis sp. 37M]